MRTLTLLLALLWLSPSLAEPLLPAQVPEPLQPWVDWMLQKHPERHCPVRHDRDDRACVWPGELSFEADQGGGRFRQRLTLYRKGLVELPGDREHWPVEVRIDGDPVVITEREGVPVVRLEPGEYRVEGRFQWSRLPDAVRIDPRTGIVRYRLAGREIPHPEIRDGRLWLQAGGQGDSAETPEDRLSMEVYRLLADGHPFRVSTQLDIEVSGGQRELLLGTPLLEGFIPLAIDSPLPARLEPDGRLRVQVRPGRWRLRVDSRYPGSVTGLLMPAQPGPWPQQEVWAYRAAHRDRLAEVQGVTQIDPRQVRLPQDWSNLPAYRITPESDFTLKVVRRGDPDPEPDRLTLERDIWLDFDGAGYTLRDRIGGRMTREWRLSVDPELALGRVTIDGEPRFITRLPGDDRNGVEVRRGRLDLTAESRLRGRVNDLPAVGWGRDFQQVGATLHLPPGWRLLAVSGADNVPSSWLQSWTLYDLFLVLIATLAVARLWGWAWSPLALVTLALTWHEPNAPTMVWLLLLGTVALLRVLPGEGRLYRLVRLARRLTLLALLVIALPFMVQQVREGLYPQLQRYSFTTTLTGELSSSGTSTSPVLSESIAPMEEGDALRSPAPGKGGGYGLKRMLHSDLDSYRALDQIDPNATIQTGPGLPGWQWRSARLQWNGPVADGQRVRLYLLGPRAQLLLNLLTVVLVLALAWRCLDIPSRSGGGRKWSRVLLFPLVLIPLTSIPVDGRAEGFPPQPLLEELEQRLLELPTRPPRAAMERMDLQLGPDGYRAALTLQALQETAVPLPLDSVRTTPLRVVLDGADATSRLYRSRENLLWLLLPQGRHQVEIESLIPPVDQLQIPLPLRPHRVVLEVREGWAVEGIDRDGVPDRQLSLTRIRKQEQADAGTLTPTVLPPFLQVERTLRFGINWEVETRVRRISPTGSTLSLQIPVVPGASVVTEGLRVKEGRVLVNMAANQTEVSWRSRLDPVESMTLTAPEESGWLETWQADIGPIWHVRIEGIPPIHHQDAGERWLPAWHPWPGERITLHVLRPAGVEGNTLTIDRSSLEVKPGKRATDSTFRFRLRASRGGQHELRLPEGAELQSVKIDNRTQPIRQDGRVVSLPVVPGEQSYQLGWRQMSGIHALWHTPPIGLGAPSVNAELRVTVPRDRWTLWVGGPQLGPAVLFWGVLLVLLLAAAVLARLSAGRLPLGFFSWLLLGIGLSQVALETALVVVGWLFLLHYRGGLDAHTTKRRFNLVQAGIVVLTFGSLGILLWTVQQGLLGLPEMQIRGNGSSAYLLNWYQDRVDGAYPEATVVSVPLLVYRLLMLAWALWLAFSLLKWLRWGWGAFSKGGIWRSIEIRMTGLKKGRGKLPERERQKEGSAGNKV